MARLALFWLVLTSGFALAAPAPKPKVKDEDAMQGKWKVVDLQHDGKPADTDYKDGVATIDKDKFSVRGGGDGKARDEVMGYTIDAGKKEIDLTPPQGNADADYRFEGLYKVDRDTLIVDVDTGGGKVRATELGPIKEVWYWEFKRVHSEK